MGVWRRRRDSRAVRAISTAMVMVLALGPSVLPATVGPAAAAIAETGCAGLVVAHKGPFTTGSDHRPLKVIADRCGRHRNLRPGRIVQGRGCGSGPGHEAGDGVGTMRRRLIITTLTAAALAAGALAGCADSDPAVPAGTTYVQAADHVAIPVDAAQLRQAQQGSEVLGLALLQRLGAGDGNMVLSPQTLVDVLAMIFPGARGRTSAQMSAALGVSGLTPDTAAAALGRIDAAARTDGNQGSNTLSVSHDVWAQSGLTLADPYLSTLQGAFGAGVHQTDFVKDPQHSQSAIDSVVSQQTHGRIPQLFTGQQINDLTRIVLTDAVYLDARWQQPFDAAATVPRTFHEADGTTVKTPMMNQDTGSFRYASGPQWQLVELPYAGGKLAMDVVLPAMGSGLAALREALTVGSLNSMLSGLSAQPVELTLPKFSTAYSPEDLAQALTALGLGGLFTNPDLAGMTANNQPLAVSDIAEKASLAVDEAGTVAAAAAGGAIATSARADAVVFNADHPFLYLIRDLPTGQILFAGQYAAP